MNLRLNFSLNSCKCMLCKHRSSVFYENLLMRYIIRVNVLCSQYNRERPKNAQKPQKTGNKQTNKKPKATALHFKNGAESIGLFLIMKPQELVKAVFCVPGRKYFSYFVVCWHMVSIFEFNFRRNKDNLLEHINISSLPVVWIIS